MLCKCMIEHVRGVGKRPQETVEMHPIKRKVISSVQILTFCLFYLSSRYVERVVVWLLQTGSAVDQMSVGVGWWTCFL